MCKISVIVPVYNARETIEKCVISIISQDFKDIELLLINDGSKDNSLEVIKELQSKNKNIIVVDRENSGAAAARNFGMSIAKGEYFCFVDSDDYIDDGALSYMYNRAVSADADILMCGYIIQNESGVIRNFAKSGEYENGAINSRIEEIKSKNLIDSPCNKLYKASFVKSSGVIMPENEIYEDSDFNLRLLKYNPKYVIDEHCFYHYILHFGSTTRRYNPQKLEIIKKRTRLLKKVTSGLDEFCDYYYLKMVFSSFIDMFLSLDKKEIKNNIKKEMESEEFILKAKNAKSSNIRADSICYVARSNSLFLAYSFSKLSYIIKYKFPRLFMRVR